jgi:L-alanine-DL-glutamate epimerase-like enolase superfamily enzyme
MKSLTGKAGGRRSFLQGIGGALGAGFWADQTLDALPQNVNTNSKPSALKITDLRVLTIGRAPMMCPIIRIDTNQGVYGLGEVRDGASKNYALMLKSRILNENPCNVDKVFRRIKQFGGPARQGGGVCAIEMAVWDIAGKVYNVPVYQMLGGKFRDRIRCYADTTESNDPKVYGQRLRLRKEQGFTWLKMDLGIDLVKDVPGSLTYPAGENLTGGGRTEHMFTGIEITHKGAELMADFVAAVREQVGMEIPLSMDHFGHISVRSCIRLAKALEKHNPAWLEDMVPWQRTELLKEIHEHIDVPLLTGEDIFLKEGFMEPGNIGRHSGDQEDRRWRPGTWRADGDAFRWHPGFLHGQCALRRGHRELPGNGKPLGGRALVERPGGRSGEADRQQRLHYCPGQARPRHHAQRRCSEAAPSGAGILRAHTAVECGPDQRPAVELNPNDETPIA